MKVICIQDEAYYALLAEVYAKLKQEQERLETRWLDDSEAMQLLHIKSKTTLQKLRDEGKIRYSQPQKKIILYDRNSIYAYLDKNAHTTF